jgi:predicted DNA-binding transcriptional regulator YafY
MTSALFSKQVKICYKKIGHEPEERIVSPQTILRYRDNWYMDVWCHLRNELRTFSLNRISKLEVLNTPAKVVTVVDLRSYYTGSYGIYSGKAKAIAKIHFTGAAAEEVSQEEWHPDQMMEMATNGDCILSIPYGDPTELVMDILRWGELAEVISPKELRDKVAHKVDLLNKKYNI